MTFFQKCLSLNKIIILTPSRQKNPIFSKGQCRMSNFFLSTVLPIKLDQNIKKLETSSSRGIWNWYSTVCNKCRSLSRWSITKHLQQLQTRSKEEACKKKKLKKRDRSTLIRACDSSLWLERRRMRSRSWVLLLASHNSFLSFFKFNTEFCTQPEPIESFFSLVLTSITSSMQFSCHILLKPFCLDARASFEIERLLWCVLPSQTLFIHSVW